MGFVKVAVEVFNKEKYRVEADAKLYTVFDLMGGCKVGRIEMGKRRASLHPEGRFERVIREAEKVFDEMRDRGWSLMSPVIQFCFMCIAGHIKPQLCLDKLGMMKEKGIWPSVATYTSVVKCLSSCGRMEDAEEFGKWLLHGRFGDDMNASGIGPDLDAYLRCWFTDCVEKKWRQACELFMEMIEKGFLPQKVTFETLYRGLIQADMLKTWRRLQKKLEEESITFGSEFKEYHLKPYKR
ncbi:Pentatricopeptide repeat-containing protein, mitochondrial [Sesamum alatum]|uniref:Pentatricopeptide repeat-containing protein, mitochondrial n=1 Tax=Sesamum alatum TaxID=300844 RepID=A0AAE1XY93_9LAMI|nr:Pentatricopeptide repeat-containing protein, mitochondrial [Sesamum alatum]